MSHHPVPGAEPADLRRIFRRQASSVSVVTAAGDGGLPAGLLVTSLASVSAAPPLVSFNVALASSSWPVLRSAEHVGLHLLRAGQQALAARFAIKGADRFGAPTDWEPGPFGVPLLGDVAAWGVARVEQRVPAGDHVIVVARLLHGGAEDGVPPLVYHDGAFHRAVPAEQPRRENGAPRLSVVREGGHLPERHRA